MNKLFEYCQHIADWRVLVQTRDVADKAITGGKIAQRVIDWYHIIVGAIRNEHLSDGCADSRVLANDSVKSRHIAPGEVKADDIGEGEVKSCHIGGGEVKTPNIANGAVTDEKLDPQLLLAIRSAAANGVALSDRFGSDDLIGVNQKTLTLAFTRIWGYLEDKFGECLQGIHMTVNPNYFIGDEGTVSITASTVEANGIFERIAFYWNDEDEGETKEHPTSFYHAENTGGIDQPVEVEIPMGKVNSQTNQIKIKCKAQIMGIEYTREQMVTRYDEFWIGAGSGWADVKNIDHSKQLNGTMRHNYDITFAEGQRLIIVMGIDLKKEFIRADLNSVEIPFEEIWLDEEYNETLNEAEIKYIVFISAPWSRGKYNIDING